MVIEGLSYPYYACICGEVVHFGGELGPHEPMNDAETSDEILQARDQNYQTDQAIRWSFFDLVYQRYVRAESCIRSDYASVASLLQ